MASRLKVQIATDDEVRARSGGEVTTRNAFDAGFPVPRGPCDDEIFGPMRFFACGCAAPPPASAPGVTCEICGQATVRVVDPPWGRPGHIVLPDAMPHPLALGAVARLVGRPVDEIRALASGAAVLVADGGPEAPPPGTVVALRELEKLRGIDETIAGQPPPWIVRTAEHWRRELGLGWSDVLYYAVSR